MKENIALELKSTINNSFLKTVSAFANYLDGKIYFGFDSDGTVCGIQNPEQACLDIEKRISDSVSPIPEFALEIDYTEKTLILHVKEGLNKPYTFKGKAYKRVDKSTVGVNQVELDRLGLMGMCRYFDQLTAQKQVLKLKYLGKRAQDVLNISKMTKDVMRAMNLFTDTGKYNNAAELLADENSFSGIIVTRYGKENDIIMEREDLSGKSILNQYEDALKIFKRYYSFERIINEKYQTEELVPERAFREVLVNALVHRTWDVSNNIQVCMYDDKIKIISPGGLPMGISYNEYMRGYMSALRNPILAHIFFSLKYIETFGTGVMRVNDAYKEAIAKPHFEVTENQVVVVLPVSNIDAEISKDEAKIVLLLKKYRSMSSSDMIKLCGFSRSKIIRLLNSLVEKKKIARSGNGRGTRYGV